MAEFDDVQRFDNPTGGGAKNCAPLSNRGAQGTCVKPIPYFYEFWDYVQGYDLAISCDGLRLRVKMLCSCVQAVDALERNPHFKLVKSYTSRSPKVGGSVYLDTFEVGNSTVTVALGQRLGSGKIDDKIGWIDFNPNKCGQDLPTLRELFKTLYELEGFSAEVVRFDVAVDYYDVVRDHVRLLRDRRDYQYVVSDGVTEYLGKRSSCGFVKVYDKKKEHNKNNPENTVSSPITRLEVTCSPDWGILEFMEKWPSAYDLDALGMDYQSAFAAFLVHASTLQDVPLDASFNALPKATRWRIKKAAEVMSPLPCPLRFYPFICEQVAQWALGDFD